MGFRLSTNDIQVKLIKNVICFVEIPQVYSIVNTQSSENYIETTDVSKDSKSA